MRNRADLPAGPTVLGPSGSDQVRSKENQRVNRTTGRVTIFDVAESAGVSYSTVSRVVNDHPNIAPETRQRVETAMKELGYVADLRARSLAGGATNVLGLLVSDVASSYISQVIRGVDHEVSSTGYDLMLCTTHQRRKRESEYVSRLINGMVDGLLVVIPTELSDYIEELESRNFPHVLLDHIGPTDKTSTVKVDNVDGVTQVLDHLRSSGHTRIGFITGRLHSGSAAVERLAAYESWCAIHSLPPDVFEGDWERPSGYAGAMHLLSRDEPPTAIVASNDEAAFGVIQYAKEHGIDIPGQLAVTGFDDVPEAALSSPGLTTVHQPLDQIGRIGIRLLIEELRDPSTPAQTIQMETELVVRESSGGSSR